MKYLCRWWKEREEWKEWEGWKEWEEWKEWEGWNWWEGWREYEFAEGEKSIAHGIDFGLVEQSQHMQQPPVFDPKHQQIDHVDVDERGTFHDTELRTCTIGTLTPLDCCLLSVVCCLLSVVCDLLSVFVIIFGFHLE